MLEMRMCDVYACVCVYVYGGGVFHSTKYTQEKVVCRSPLNPCSMLDKHSAAVQLFSILLLLLLIDYYHFLMLSMNFIYTAGCLSG